MILNMADDKQKTLIKWGYTLVLYYSSGLDHHGTGDFNIYNNFPSLSLEVTRKKIRSCVNDVHAVRSEFSYDVYSI